MPRALLALSLAAALLAPPALARQITDMAGRTIEVPDQVHRIYAMSHSLALVTVMAPDLLIGLPFPFRRNPAAEPYLPARYRDLPALDGNLEQLKSLAPDLALGWTTPSFVRDRVPQFERIGLPVVLVQVDRLRDYPASFRFLGRLLGREQRGEALAAHIEAMEARLTAVTAALPKEGRPRVYYAESIDGLTSQCDSSSRSDVIEMAGGINALHCVNPPTSADNYPIDLETLVAADPDVIVVRQAETAKTIATDPRWAGLRAVAAGRVYVVPSLPFNWFDRPLLHAGTRRALARRQALAGPPAGRPRGRNQRLLRPVLRRGPECRRSRPHPDAGRIVTLGIALAPRRPRHLFGWPLTFGGLLAVSVLVSLSIGRFPVSAGEILHFLAAAAGLAEMAPERFATLANILIDIRLPRVLAAMLVGMALAVSGAAFQSVFRNPLVSPGLLGVLAGASFGAALGMVLDGSWLLVQTLSFLMGLAAVTCALLIANAFGPASMVTLVLGGLVASALFGALLSIVKYVADPFDQLPAIVYWLMGNLGLVALPRLAWLGLPMAAAAGLMAVLGRGLDALAMGDDEARALGVPVAALRYGVIAAATLASALTVSIAGMIGWIGLIVPHVARLLLGPGNARLLPASALLGAAFLVAADALGRTVAETEIPIGIVTEVMGIPAFLLVLHRARRGWS